MNLAAQTASAQQAPPPPQTANAQQTPPPQTASPQIAAPVPRPVTPVPLGLSGQVNTWLSVRGEFRGRLEGFTGGAYRPDNSDGYMLDRFRLNATVDRQHGREVRRAGAGRARVRQDGRRAGVPFRDTLDLRMAYGEFGGARNMVRVGRQELAFGEQRLIGHLNWVNTARSFDGARATIARKPGKFDVFAASVVTIQPEGFDKSGNGNRLYGFYGSPTMAIPKATLEPYFFWRQSEASRSKPAVSATSSGDERRAHGGQAAGRLRLRRRDGGADRLGRDRRS